MYTAAFGLREKPFSITPNPEFLFLSRRHRDALAHLVYGVRERAGFVQLTGEVGTGKTLLTRALLQRLPGRVEVALIYRPGGTVTDFVEAILRELGVELPPLPHSAETLVERLNAHLMATHAEGRTTVLLIDEAQNLGPRLVEQLRLLTNLETAHEKLLQIILVGQPELDTLLRRPELRQVSQRIAARYHLQPLSGRETAAYVEHRLRIAGAARPLFTAAALRRLHRASGGVPRLINLIADRALLGAWTAERARVGTREVDRAADEVGSSPRRPRWPLIAGAGLLAGLATAVTVVALGPAPGWSPFASERARTLAAPERVLAPLLEDATLDRAFAQLLAVWGHAADGEPVHDCDSVRALDLRCHYGDDGAAGVLRHDRPAIVELLDDSGARRPLLLTALSAGTAEVRVEEASLTVPRAELEQRWTGDYLILWQPPAISPLPAEPGDRGSAIAWLRARLGSGAATAEDDPEVFDTALAERLRGYQQSAGLPVTGRLDDGTVLHLRGDMLSPAPALRRLESG